MLTKQLDQETEQLLAEILQQENTTTDELIRALIRDRWLAMQKQADESLESETAATLPNVPLNAARQKSNKQAIAQYMKKKRFC
ncbi:MAG: hypothetical protein Kow00121_68190 [Elainellaceae cyanobacterium]